MHHAKLENSPRLQRVLSLLRNEPNPQSTMDIIHKANVCAVNSAVAELRENGISIECQQEGRIFYYWLAQNG